METELMAIKKQMRTMLADQFYHQPGDVIQIKREELVDMLALQTLHGINLGKESCQTPQPQRGDKSASNN